MSVCQSFTPIEPAFMRVLVLGSMPGVASLTEQAYYAHPRNAFWPIMASLLAVDWPTDYLARYGLLQQQQVGLWDVLAQCERPGSLDSAIKKQSIQINDISSLVARHSECRAIALNGGKAAELFKRYVLPSNPVLYAPLKLIELPSTSPANARLSLADKTCIWQDKLANFL